MVGVRHAVVARHMGFARSPDQSDDPRKRGENHTHDGPENENAHRRVAFRKSGKRNAEQAIDKREDPPSGQRRAQQTARLPHKPHDWNQKENGEDGRCDDIALQREPFGSRHAVGDENPSDEYNGHADTSADAGTHSRIVGRQVQFVLEMGLLMAHERWASTRLNLNPELRRMLRDVGGYLRGGCALVTREVDGSHAIPILMAGRDTSITIRRGEQQVLRDRRTFLAFDITAIDPIAGEVLLGVDGPGYVYLQGGRCGLGIFDRGGDYALRR
jgi:hypothetical protein